VNGLPGAGRVGPLATVWRGVRGRCGRCGCRGVVLGYFRLQERCPCCGYRFRREEGFLAGVYLVNFTVTTFLMWLVLMTYIIWRAGSGSDAALWPIMVICVGLGLVAPIVAYPFAATTWAALDLVMRPLEPDEEADAATWAAAEGPGPGAAAGPTE
jgi:uncharacterized protein (DUF983 family)